jgi:hypothetical protein
VKIKKIEYKYFEYDNQKYKKFYKKQIKIKDKDNNIK